MPTGNIIRSVRQTVLRKAISHLLCNRFDTLHGQRIRPRHRQHNLLVGVDDAADRVGAGLMDDGVERQDFERSVPLSTETKGREERPLLADIVAKVPKGAAANFPPKNETSDNRRSIGLQTRYQNRR
jgi:hypothetical protein